MTATAAIARPKAPFYRGRTILNYQRNADNALLSGFQAFVKQKLCYQNRRPIDSAMGKSEDC